MSATSVGRKSSGSSTLCNRTAGAGHRRFQDTSACSCLSVIACISWCREVYMINKINSSSGPCFYISCETLITCEIPIPHTIPRTIPRTIPGGIPGGIPRWIPGWISRCCGRASWIVPKLYVYSKTGAKSMHLGDKSNGR